MTTPLVTLGALAAHMQAWDGSAGEARAQVQLAGELLGQLRDRAARAYRHEQADRLGLPSDATDAEIAEASVRQQDGAA